jgi:hypothetical protein
MVAGRRMRLVRCILLTGLCYCLVLQTLMVQSEMLAAAAADPQPVLCHGNGDQNSPDSDGAFAGCHFCCLPTSYAALIPAANPCIPAAAIAVAASPYPFFPDSLTVTKPPPRGFSRAPPHFA